MVSESAKRISFFPWARRIAAIAVFLSFGVFAYSVLAAAFIPAKYLWDAMPLYTIATLLIVWLLIDMRRLKKRTVITTILIVVAVVLTAANIYGTVVLRSANNLLSSIQASSSNYVEYAIITVKTRNVTVDGAKSVALISDSDPLYDKAKVVLKNETSAAQRPVDSLAALKNSLEQGDVELAAVRQESLGLIEDQDADFYDTLTTLRTFRVEDTATSTKTLDASKPYAVYISGIDTYGSVSTVSRSDVNMLLVVNPEKHTMLLVNTPRDYYVQLHGTTGRKDKLTHAGIYGIDTSRQTLEDLYGIDIPYYVRINFTSLVNVINAVGPINVYSDYDFKSYHTGYNTLDSKHALEFARERYSFEEGDRQRGRNQQHVIEAIIDKMAKPENSVRLPQIMNSISSSVETNLSEDSLKVVIHNQLNDIRGWSVTSISVDGTGAMLPTYSYGDTPLYVMQPDPTSLTNAEKTIKAYLK